MSTAFISLAFIVTICFSIALGVIYSRIDFNGFPTSGFSPETTIYSLRHYILVPYGFISAFALILISLAYYYYTKKLWNLLKNNNFLKGKEFKDQRKYVGILFVIFSISFAVRIPY